MNGFIIEWCVRIMIYLAGKWPDVCAEASPSPKSSCVEKNP